MQSINIIAYYSVYEYVRHKYANAAEVVRNCQPVHHLVESNRVRSGPGQRPETHSNAEWETPKSSPRTLKNKHEARNNKRPGLAFNSVFLHLLVFQGTPPSSPAYKATVAV